MIKRRGKRQQPKHAYEEQSTLTDTALDVFVAHLSFSSAVFPNIESLFPADESGIPLILVSNWELSL